MILKLLSLVIKLNICCAIGQINDGIEEIQKTDTDQEQIFYNILKRIDGSIYTAPLSVHQHVINEGEDNDETMIRAQLEHQAKFILPRFVKHAAWQVKKTFSRKKPNLVLPSLSQPTKKQMTEGKGKPFLSVVSKEQKQATLNNEHHEYLTKGTKQSATTISTSNNAGSSLIPRLKQARSTRNNNFLPTNDELKRNHPSFKVILNKKELTDDDADKNAPSLVFRGDYLFTKRQWLKNLRAENPKVEFGGIKDDVLKAVPSFSPAFRDDQLTGENLRYRNPKNRIRSTRNTGYTNIPSFSSAFRGDQLTAKSLRYSNPKNKIRSTRDTVYANIPSFSSVFRGDQVMTDKKLPYKILKNEIRSTGNIVNANIPSFSSAFRGDQGTDENYLHRDSRNEIISKRNAAGTVGDQLTAKDLIVLRYAKNILVRNVRKLPKCRGNQIVFKNTNYNPKNTRKEKKTIAMIAEDFEIISFPGYKKGKNNSKMMKDDVAASGSNMANEKAISKLHEESFSKNVERSTENNRTISSYVPLFSAFRGDTSLFNKFNPFRQIFKKDRSVKQSTRQPSSTFKGDQLSTPSKFHRLMEQAAKNAVKKNVAEPLLLPIFEKVNAIGSIFHYSSQKMLRESKSTEKRAYSKAKHFCCMTFPKRAPRIDKELIHVISELEAERKSTADEDEIRRRYLLQVPFSVLRGK